MAPTTPQDPTLSVVSKKWDADNKGFLTDEERALRKLDTEGTGTLTAKQLSTFTDQYAALRKENKQIKRGLAGLGLLTVLLFVGTVVASVLAAQASRDTATNPTTGVMMAKDTNSPVSVNNNEIPLPVAALPFLPPDVVAHVKYVSFSGPTDGATFHRTVGAIDTVASTSLVITTTTGDKVTWPSADGDEDELTVTLADGTSWNKPATCVACVAANVLATEENQQGIDAFKERLGENDRRLLERRLTGTETYQITLKRPCESCYLYAREVAFYEDTSATTIMDISNSAVTELYGEMSSELEHYDQYGIAIDFSAARCLDENFSTDYFAASDDGQICHTAIQANPLMTFTLVASKRPALVRIYIRTQSSNQYSPTQAVFSVEGCDSSSSDQEFSIGDPSNYVDLVIAS